MSKLFDDASLAMIPSAYKDGKLYSIRPTDGDGDFTFSRGSNLAATRVDVNGLIEKGRENVLRNSNAPNTHTTNLSTYSGSQADPFGGNTAWAWRETATTGQHYGLTDSTTTLGVGVWTFSVYVKPVNKTSVYFTWNSPSAGNYGNTTFTFSSKTFTSGNAIAEGYEELSNGWFRLYFAINVTSAGVWNVYYNQLGSYTGDVNNGYDFTRFQIERGLVATDYIETGATTAQAGILEDMPRLDYSGGASCPSLLLEPQRTNKIAQSEYQVSLWYPSTTWTIQQNTSDLLSPEGLNNAVKLIETSANSYHSGYYNATIENNYTGTYTISAYAKYNGRFFVLNPYNTGVGRTYFNLQTGEVSQLGTNVTAGIEDAGDGWYRCYVTGTYSSSNVTFEHMLASAVGTLVYQGDGTSGAYIYGCQAESGSYPTSYIPTYGSSVTRSNEYFNTDINLQTEDILSSTWTFLYDQTYVDEPRDVAAAVFLLDNGKAGGDGQTNIRIALQSGGDFRLQDSDGSQYTTDGNKILGRYDGSKISWYVDGALLNEHSVTDVDFANLNRYNPSSQSGKIVKVNQIVIFPTALTDSECIALTTI